jgi:hypothetical protein
MEVPDRTYTAGLIADFSVFMHVQNDGADSRKKMYTFTQVVFNIFKLNTAGSILAIFDVIREKNILRYGRIYYG